MSISSHSREAFDHVYAWLKKEPWKSRFQDYFNETLTELAEYHEMELDGFVAQARLSGALYRNTSVQIMYRNSLKLPSMPG